MILVIKYGIIVGAICFAIGFISPIIFMPDSNQGPLLGIFITGPLGFILGIILGIVFKVIQKHNPEYKHPLYKLFQRF